MQRCLEILVLTIILAGQGAAQLELRTVDGKKLVGVLKSVDEHGVVRFRSSDGAVAELSTKQIVSIRQPSATVRQHDAGSPFLRFEMADGDLIFANVTESDYDEVKVSSSTLGSLALPLDSIHQVVILANAAGVPSRLGSDLPQDRDIVFIRSGDGVDHVVGEVARFARGGVYFEWNDQGETLFSFVKDKVVGVRLGEPEALERPKGVYAVVHCRDGSRLSGTITREPGAEIKLRLFNGAEIALKTPSVAEITFRNGDFDFLSDLKAEVHETPYIEGGLVYGLHRDLGLSGRPVTISDVHFSKALSVHSRCVLEFDLGGRYRSFTSAIGLDGAVAQSSVKGAVSFSVLVDDKVVVAPTVMRAGEAPRWLEGVDVSGAEKLTLKADFADRFHFNGWAVWGAPILAR